MNKVILQGRITKDLEPKYSKDGGTALLSFTVAVNRKYQKEGEEKQADFIMCKAFGKTAENISNFFGKGRLILLEGRIQTGSYDKDGTKVYTTDVIVEGFDFCGEKKQEATTEHTVFEQAQETAESDLPF